MAAVERAEPSRFDSKVLHDAMSRHGSLAESPGEIPGFEEGRSRWASFEAATGAIWDVRLDRRSGAPLQVQGSGLRWYDPAGPMPDPRSLEALARRFVESHETLFRIRSAELAFDPEASVAWDADRIGLLFNREVEGIPVEGHRFHVYLVRGNVVSFGAGRWGPPPVVPNAVYGVETTRLLLHDHMGIRPGERVEEIESGTLVLTPVPPAGAEAGAWKGAPGDGVAYRLVHRFVLRVAGEPGTWVGKVDAVTGEVVAFYDDEKYAQAKGWVYPVAADGICEAGGCNETGYPMPYANVTVGGAPQTTNDAGIFDCSGGTASTALQGPYVRINDNCGAVDESGVCDEDLDLGGNAGTNCTVPAGKSAGDTNASRTGFYHINRIKEKGRYWLPSNNWLRGQVQVNVNVNSTCNASWSGQLNMYRAGGGCRNTAETAGVLNHEYGHGLDQNDGGGYDNTSEAYADVIAILSDRASCVGRGFFESGTCSGYGDTCLTCTGIRDMDFAARQANTPATPANFTGPRCGGGSGPCGKETHCESYPPSEAIYDLATRDLPAAGLDPISAWQLTEKLFMKSRQGSGGPIFNCSLPNSDGCNAGGWYNTMRIADDDDGNLANGTPHAAAIYAAFARHAIACGSAGAPENQSTSSCPSLATPALSAANGSNSVTLSWNAVPNASKYLILRTEFSCDFTQNVIAEVPAPTTTYVDDDLPNGFTFHYRVQAQGANAACESPVSPCAEGTPQPFAGTVKFDKPAYSCASAIQVSVTDANVGAPTVAVEVWSATETLPETLTLSETSPGSAKYVGTFVTTSAPPANGDGSLSVADGDLLTARYVDGDDGEGGSGLERLAHASADCRAPFVTGIGEAGLTDTQATIVWSTDEGATSVVRWGELKPPSETASVSGLVTSHGVPLAGLRSCTVYWYAVESGDFSGNVTVDDRSGQYHSFETLGNFGEGLQPCHAGSVSLSKAILGCADSLPIKLVDLDLNLDPQVVELASVRVSSSTEPGGEIVFLTETGPNTSQFTGSIATFAGPPAAGDGFLSSTSGDFLTATYDDADDGTGVPATSFATAIADCSAPSLSNVRVTDITDDGATVRWNTSEPGTSKLEWGPTPALGNVVTDGALRTTHALTMRPAAECGRLYFRVSSTDAYGNTIAYDAAGAPFEFNLDRIPGLFRDTFETTTGWTLEGDWQIGTPRGLGTPQPDPSAAFEGSKVLGQDLTGLGAYPGDFEPGTNFRAISPVINGASLTGGQLKFRRWLNVSGSGVGIVEVRKNGVWNTVWSSPSLVGIADSAWSLQSIDISQFADANAQLQIAFRGFAGPGSTSHSASWNVDRFIVKSASQPDFVACGGCGGAPTFAGLASAEDLDGCAGTGVGLAWAAAPAWGTGSAGTYSVYRSTDPSFLPGPANRIAAGVGATSYTDLSAPKDVTLHYAVRAENDETCSTGPNNGGVTEANLVRVAARDDTAQPHPGDVASTLRNDPVNGAHVRLTWQPTGTASAYRVYRAAAPQGPFSLVAETAGALWEDKDGMGDSADRFYVVRAVDSCGNEGP
jgi:hypothetical protein